MLIQRRAEFIFEAEQPIAHHAGTDGNHSYLQTRSVRRKGGGFVDIPEVTGDTMRHAAREVSSYAMLRAAGMLEASLSEGALRLLFAGGMVTGRGDAGVINLDRYRELCSLVPPMALFGGCTDNRVQPGKLNVEAATLICAETMRFLPEWVTTWLAANEEAVSEARTHIDEVQRVRMDPLLIPGKRVLLLPEEQTKAAARLTAGERAHEGDDAPAAKEAKSAMLPRTYETIKQGSLLFWRIEVTCHSALEEDTFMVVLSELHKGGPIVGGKRGTGNGRLRMIAAKGVELQRTVERAEDLTALVGNASIGDLFNRHITERAENIRDFFRTVNA